MATRAAIAITLLILLGYGVMEAWPLVRGPELTLTSPGNEASVPGGLVTVSGSAKRVTALTLDGAPLIPDENGAFSTLIELPRGGAILTLTATDRFGRSTTRQESVFVPY